MPSLFVVYSFHSPQVLEFCSCMPLSATTFFSVCFPVSSGPLYFSSEFCGLYLFILERADSLVSISGLRPLPGWDNGVHSSRPRTAGTSAMEKNPPSHFPSPTPPPPPPPPPGLAVRTGKLVAWEIWARFVRMGIYLAMRARTGV